MYSEPETFTVIDDEELSTGERVVKRANFTCEEEACAWMRKYEKETSTRWIVHRGKKEGSCDRMICRKIWVCHYNGKNKSVNSKKKTDCQAKISIKIKFINKSTKRNDRFLRQIPPLPAVIEMKTVHNHSTISSDALKLLRANPETKNTFVSYFDNGLGPSSSIKLNKDILEMSDGGQAKLQNSSLNPSYNTVAHWYHQWKEKNLGTVVNPLQKIKEKLSGYNDIGVQVIVEETTFRSWAVVIVTPLMRRIQMSEEARAVVFVDTSSCDKSEVRVTSLFASTKAGPMPLAVALHNPLEAESYLLALNLVKQNFPLCFGGKSAPHAFATDYSEETEWALQEVWGGVQQIPCRFHVALNEWKLLRNKDEKQRVDLTKLFHKLINARSEEEFALAQASFFLTCKDNQYKARITKLLQRNKLWGPLLQKCSPSRQMDEHSFSEANLRVVKDIILARTKSFNVVAFTDFVVHALDKYFRDNLLTAAYNFSSPYVLNNKLVKLMPDEAASSIEQATEIIYNVPSTKSSFKMHEVDAVLGMCTCYFGCFGSFCKHQALVHRFYSKVFPDPPQLVEADREVLARLALGDNCPRVVHPNVQEPDLVSTSVYHGLESDDINIENLISKGTPNISILAEEVRRVAALGLVNPKMYDKIDLIIGHLKEIKTQTEAHAFILGILTTISRKIKRKNRGRTQKVKKITNK